jgi:DNA-binding NarL/FixJ family response regulator
VPEIARQLGLSDGTVKRYLSDAIDALEGVLGPLPNARTEDVTLIQTGSRR